MKGNTNAIGKSINITIDGVEQQGELKLTTRHQLAPVNTSADFLPTTGFGYKGQVHGIKDTTHKKLVDDKWVDDVTLPTVMAAFCSDDDYAYGMTKLGALYRFDSSAWTQILKISEITSSTDIGNLIHDNGKLYCAFNKTVYIIDLSTLTYTTLATPMYSSSYQLYRPKLFRLKGELYIVSGYFGNSVISDRIYKYNATSQTWKSEYYLYNSNFAFAPVCVFKEKAYILGRVKLTMFDGDNVQEEISNLCVSEGTMFDVDGQLYLIGTHRYISTTSSTNTGATNIVATLKKVLCLEG